MAKIGPVVVKLDIQASYKGYSINSFLDFDPGRTDEDQVKCRSTRIVKSVKPHHCFRPRHGDFVEKPSGTFTLIEKANVDGHWRECRMALDDIISYWKSQVENA